MLAFQRSLGDLPVVPLGYWPDTELSAPADNPPFFLFFPRSTSINLKKHLSSFYPEPCQMRSTSKSQVNAQIV